MHRNDRIMILLGIILVIVALVGAAVGGSPKISEDGTEPEVDYHDWPTKRSSVQHITGEVLSENSYTTITISNINESYITHVYFELHWEDEDNLKDAGYYKVENQPDYFNFTVLTPWGDQIDSDTGASSHGGAGVILEDTPVPDDESSRGDWVVTIYCGDCGDQVAVGPVVGEGPVVEEDTGNGWELSYYYDFHSNT
ncbi:hypothetical protein [[Eubacterium] cellulosolvens]